MVMMVCAEAGYTSPFTMFFLGILFHYFFFVYFQSQISRAIKAAHDQLKFQIFKTAVFKINCFPFTDCYLEPKESCIFVSIVSYTVFL